MVETATAFRLWSSLGTEVETSPLALAELVLVREPVEVALVMLIDAFRGTTTAGRCWPVALSETELDGFAPATTSSGLRIRRFADWADDSNLARARRALDCWPRAIDDGQTLARAMYLSGWHARGIDGNGHGAAGRVVVLAQGWETTIAAALALRRGWELRLAVEPTDVLMALNTSLPVLLVLANDAVTTPGLTATLCARQQPTGCLIGAWTDLTSWIARIESSSPESAISDLLVSCRFGGLDSVPTVGRERWTADSLREALEQPHDVLMLYLHGLPDRLFVGDLTISGIPSSPQTIPPSALRARHIFADTCSGAHLDPGPPPVTQRVGLNALGGVLASYASTTSVKDNSWEECLLYYALIRCGVPLGHAVGLVNRWLEASGRDAPCYVLLGDPTQVVRAPSATASVTRPGTQPEWMVEFGGDAAVAVIEDPDCYEFAATARLWAELLGSRPDVPVFSVPIREQRSVVLICTRMNARSETLQFRITERPLVNRRLSALGATLPTRLRRLSYLRALPSGKATGLSRHLEGAMTRLQRLAVAGAGFATRDRDLDDAERSAAGAVERLQEIVVGHELDRLASPATFTEPYREHYSVVRTREGPPCECGASTFVKTLAMPFDSESERAVQICRTCGVLSDVPAFAPIGVALLGLVRHGESLTAELALRSMRMEHAAVSTGALLTSHAHAADDARPARTNVVTRTVGATEEVIRLEVRCPPDDGDSARLFRVVFVSDLELTVLQRPVVPG